MPEDHMDELYNSSNPIVKFVHRARLKAIMDVMPETKGLKVLDAGCGEGHLIEMLNTKFPENKYYGADVTEVALKRARGRCPLADFRLEDLSDLKFEDKYFDVVIITEVLEHIFDYKKVITELKRVLKKGGILIITFPNEFLWTAGRFVLGIRPPKVPDHVNSFSPAQIENLAGMRVVDRRGLPLRWPFLISLGYLIKFKK